ncbi:MAG: proline dehydrogenase family protein [Candidatus Dormibacteraeota bacterium]|nr:proline dehydrogenase family protein [Candidatus Dormibacteraeota bacterium]
MRQTLLWASRRRTIKQLVSNAPVTSGLVRRFVAGEDTGGALDAARALTRKGLQVSLDHLGEDTPDRAAAQATVDVLQQLIGRLHDEGLTPTTEISMKLSALGQALDESMALEHAASVCEAARSAGTTVTVDMEDHTTTDSTLRILSWLRADYPDTGAVMQASLRRSFEDCRSLAHQGSRVRLCKGAYQEPSSVAWQTRSEVRSAYLRCLAVLIDGGAYPMVATHDPALIDAARRMFNARSRNGHDHEFQMLYGIRPDEQLRLVAAGEKTRIYTPFGSQWYGYLMRRMAERPANLALVLRAVARSR